MVPCCLKIISCEEYAKILKDVKGNGLEHWKQITGGAIGKHESCPKDAAHAHQLPSGE